jgi:hypothetical protein
MSKSKKSKVTKETTSTISTNDLLKYKQFIEQLIITELSTNNKFFRDNLPFDLDKLVLFYLSQIFGEIISIKHKIEWF